MPASTLLDRAAPAGTPDLMDGQWAGSVHPDQLTLPLTWEVAPGVPSVPPIPVHLRLVASPEAEQAPPEGTLALTAPWVARMARAIIEVADGDRPAAQLARWVERAPLAMLSARGVAYRRHPAVRTRRGALSAARAVQQVRAVRLCPLNAEVVEASAVLIGGGRGRALALRFERRGSNWIVAAIALG